MLVLKTLGVLVLLALVAFLVAIFLGSRLPHEHTASATALVNAPQARVWQLITDTPTQPAWRKA